MNYFPTASLIWAAKVGLFLSLLGVLIAISQSALMTADALIPAALAIDFIFSVPVAYFLLIRKTSVPRITVVPVLTPALSGLWLGLVTPAQARIGRALVEGLRNSTIVRSSGAIVQWPASGSRIRANRAGLSKRGMQSQSIAPSRETSAEVLQSESRP